MTIHRIGIVANTNKERSLEYTMRLRDWIVQRGLQVHFHKRIAEKIGGTAGYETKQLASMVDLLAVFGGDGTLLRTARAVREFTVPILASTWDSSAI